MSGMLADTGSVRWTRAKIWGWDFRVLDDDLLPYGLVSLDHPLLYVGRTTSRYMLECAGDDLVRGTEIISAMLRLRTKQASLVADSSWIKAVVRQACDAVTKEGGGGPQRLNALEALLEAGQSQVKGMDDSIVGALAAVQALREEYLERVR